MSAEEDASGLAPLPIHILAGHVRNKKEAQTLIGMDCRVAQHELLLDHLLACCAHERELARALRAIDTCSQRDLTSLNGPRALISSALDTVRCNIDSLVAEIDGVLCGLSESAHVLKQYAESNEALALELLEEGSAPSVAAAKQRLWLVEESLCARVETTIADIAHAQHGVHSQDRRRNTQSVRL